MTFNLPLSIVEYCAKQILQKSVIIFTVNNLIAVIIYQFFSKKIILVSTNCFNKIKSMFKGLHELTTLI